MGLGGRKSDTSRKKKHSITVSPADLPRLKVIREGAKCKDNNEVFKWMLVLAEKYLGVDTVGASSSTTENLPEEARLTEIPVSDLKMDGEETEDLASEKDDGRTEDIVSNAAKAIREDLEKEGDEEIPPAEKFDVIVSEVGSTLQLLDGEKEGLENSSSQEEEGAEKAADSKTRPRRSRRVRQSKEGRFKCSMCPFRYPTKEAVLQHEETHGRKVQVCEKCDKEFVNVDALKAHIRFVHDKKFDCSDCDKKFGTKYLLMQHRRSHTGEKPFVCETCNKGFTTSSSLKAHMESHNVSRSYLCHECGAAYRRRDCLKQHILRCHKTEDEFQCEMCGKSFKYRESLKNHLEHHKNSDQGKYPYQCHLCGKGYTLAVTLRRHMNSHETVFQCDVCNRQFSHRHHLKRHSIVHTGERPFVCGYCDRTFGLRTTLLTHLRLHTGEKPYKCKMCPIAFRRNYSLKNHMKKAHGIEVPNRSPGSLPLKDSNQDNVPTEVMMELQLQQEETGTQKELIPETVPIHILQQIDPDGNVDQQTVTYSTSAEGAVVASELVDSAESQQAVMTLANMSHQLMNMQQMEELQQQVQQQIQQAEEVQQQVQEVHIQQLEDGTQTVEYKYVTFPVNFTSIPTSEAEPQDAIIQ
ncbi:uncharacterized protein [Diadema setosum]|uniref:uncharacterized protein n=1 Tax=Diadema setosum TaxID=31175 RepID=UPI003B3A9CCF